MLVQGNRLVNYGQGIEMPGEPVERLGGHSQNADDRLVKSDPDGELDQHGH